MSDKLVKTVIAQVMKGSWEKFTKPSVSRGGTTFPKTAAEQERYGIRFDYDTVVTRDNGTEYHMFKMQPNAGKVPASIGAWRDKNGGTHAVMATVFVKKDGTADDVENALNEAREAFKNA